MTQRGQTGPPQESFSAERLNPIRLDVPEVADVCFRIGRQWGSMALKTSLILILFCSSLELNLPDSALAQEPWSGILAPSRAVDWSQAGVPGGIPSGGANWTQCGSTIAAGASAATINAAISACGTDQYVQLGAGTFNLTAGLLFNDKSNVALRGMGADQTLLVFTGDNPCQGNSADICFQSTDTNYSGGPSNLANWTSGYASGSTSIVLSSNTNLTVGKPITLDQLDGSAALLNSGWSGVNVSLLGLLNVNLWQVSESAFTPVSVKFNGVAGTQMGSIAAITGTNGWFWADGVLYVYSVSSPLTAFINPGITASTDDGDIFLCYTPQYVCSTNGDSGGGPRPGRSQQQIVTVTSISGSGPYTVGITPGLDMPNWSAANTPQAWWPTSPISMSGVENLSIDNTNSGSQVGVEVFNCYGCWVTGIRSIDPIRSHVQLFQSNHVTVQNNYFYETAYATSESYGVEMIPSSDSLIQNNIFQHISGPLVVTGSCSGCVLSYNFDIDDIFYNGSSYNWQQQGIYPHAVGDDHILVEGNQGAGVYSDNFHGTHHFQTIFRNVFNGFQPNNGTVTQSNTIPMILMAYSRFYNVIGNVLGSTALPDTVYENSVSDPNSGNPVYSIGFGDEIPNDPNTPRTLMRWGNYTVIPQASDTPANSGIRFVASEVPSSIVNYSNPVPSSTTLPPSFYLSGRPSWWPSTKPWPAIGPDVTGGNLPGYAGHAYSIPAADCYSNVMGGPANGTGNVLSFNATACYGGVTPSPPTGLGGQVVH
jgi:hypothetical protein